MLFQTELYRRIEEALKQAAKAIESLIKETQGNLQFILEQARAESAEKLAERLHAERERFSEVQQSLNRLEEAEKQTQERLVHGRSVLEKLQELRNADEALAGLEQKTTIFAHKRTTLERARKAAAVVGEEKALNSRIREAEETAAKLKKAREAAVSARKALEEAVTSLNREKERQPELERGRNDLTSLESLTDRVRELTDARSKLAAADKDLSKREADVATAQHALDDCIAAVEKNRQATEEVAGIAGRLELLRVSFRQAEKAFQQRKKLAEVTLDAAGIESQLNEAERRADAARQARD